MNKRLILLWVTSLFVMITSCKKEENKINDIQSDTNTIVTETISKSTPPSANGKYPELSFEKQEHDFGTIKQGDKVTYEFKFKNTGQADLLISDAKGSCGCTVPEYPKDALKPGESGVIKVSFNSAGKSGKQTKSVTLFCNIKEGKKVLHINSNIEVPEKD